MYYTYILKQTNKKKYYVGYTDNLKRRLIQHNCGSNISTRGRMWVIYCYFAFDNRASAINFEKYLKSHSGRPFSKKHFGFEFRDSA
ncbi:GIY-YIG nuclease family protein [Patescibacteria group bacterium]|nr:GIY-YIG nuclease family protein [Patescibacteria group bacterium]